MIAASARFCCRKTTEVVAVTPTNQGASLSKVRIAKFHAALIGDTTVYAETRRKEAVRCFFRQGDLSSGCGIYCVATALAVLGVVKANAMESAANRKHGLVREVFRALQHTYFDGVTASELYDALEAIPLPLKLTLRDAESNADIAGRRKVEKLALTGLSTGCLVMIAYQCERPDRWHWVLGVGCGGIQHGRRTLLDTIYVLDPGDETIPLAVYNAVLQRPTSKSHGSEWIMHCRDGSIFKSTLVSAIRFEVT